MITEGSPSLAGALASPTFWLGVGPGNFAGPYLKYKLPQASEEIVDPHNLFLEVWAAGGFLAFLCLVLALALAFWNLVGPPGREAPSSPLTSRAGEPVAVSGNSSDLAPDFHPRLTR